MSPVTVPSIATQLTPAMFCERLLEAVAADSRHDARSSAQRAILLRPILSSNLDAATFEKTLRQQQARNSELADTAREILALWRVCEWAAAASPSEQAGLERRAA
jgi:hypothetical protein